MASRPWIPNPIDYILGRDDDGTSQQDTRRIRAVNSLGGILRGAMPSNEPAPFLRPPGSGPGDQLSRLDPETVREIERIQMEGELALAEHAQRVAVANAEAGQQRRAVQRDIGIQNTYRPEAIRMTNEGYDDLIGTLQGIIPMTQQGYDTGVAEIGQAYDTSVQNLVAPAQGAVDLGAQLQAIAGEGANEFAADVNDPLAYYQSLLGASGDAGQNVLQTLGQGDVAAAYAALPGYRTEQGTAVNDINLEVDAELNNLRNELSMITPDFVPFNQGALQLEQERAIADAIQSGLARRRQEEEENYQGYRGVQNLAADYGRPDLAGALFDIMSVANSGLTNTAEGPNFGQAIPADVAIQQAINAYTSRDPRRTRQDQAILQQLIEAYMGNY